jgi:hypothetical protein
MIAGRDVLWRKVDGKEYKRRIFCSPRLISYRGGINHQPSDIIEKITIRQGQPEIPAILL